MAGRSDGKTVEKDQVPDGKTIVEKDQEQAYTKAGGKSKHGDGEFYTHEQAHTKAGGKSKHGRGEFYTHKNPRNIPLGCSSHISQPLPEAGATGDVHLDLLKDLKRMEKGLASDTGDVSLYSSKDVMKGEMVLNAREEQLNKKEQELARREEALARDNIVIKKKNVERILEKYSARWRNISNLKSELVSTLNMCNKDEQSTSSCLKEMSAVQILSRDLTADVMSTIKAVNERPRKNRSDLRVQDVAVIYDERLLLHKPPSQLPSQGQQREIPERCQVFDCDEADMESLKAVHDPGHISDVKKISSKGKETVDGDMYYSFGTTLAALLAAGGVVKAADLVANGVVEDSFAIIRPPGHHVGINGPPKGEGKNTAS